MANAKEHDATPRSIRGKVSGLRDSDFGCTEQHSTAPDRRLPDPSLARSRPFPGTTRECDASAPRARAHKRGPGICRVREFRAGSALRAPPGRALAMRAEATSAWCVASSPKPGAPAKRAPCCPMSTSAEREIRPKGQNSRVPHPNRLDRGRAIRPPRDASDASVPALLGPLHVHEPGHRQLVA